MFNRLPPGRLIFLSMEITREQIEQAALENAEKYIERAKNISVNAFEEGAQWAFDLVAKMMGYEAD